MGRGFSMEYLWYLLTLLLFTGYVVLDGFDLGAGLVHVFVARNEKERKQVLAAIGPYWDGNEVWLIAAGGTLFLAFPALFAAAFSGFYLPLMLLLWCLILRGIAIEFRNHIQHDAWTPAWDFTFALASLLLCFLFGATVGNIIRGVPLKANGEFFLPLWTDFTARGESGVLDWYTLLTALLAVAALGMHGALWVTLKVPQPFARRVQHFSLKLWPILAIITTITTAATFQIKPTVFHTFLQYPFTFLLPAGSLLGLIGMRQSITSTPRTAFLFSAASLVLLVATAAATNFPAMLPSTSDPEFSLTISNTKASAYELSTALYWWFPGMALVIAYFVFLYRRFAGPIDCEIETSEL